MQFIQSFKDIKKPFLWVMLYDFLFISLFGLCGFVVSTRISSRLKEVVSYDFSKLQMDPLNAVEAEQMLGLVKGFMIYYIIALLVLGIIFILLWSLFKSLAWSKVADKGFSLRYFNRFTLLSIIFWVVAFVFSVFIFVTIDTGYAVLYALLLGSVFFYLNTILSYTFVSKQRLGKSFGSIIDVGLRKIHHFILPYIFVMVVGIVLLIIIYFVGKIGVFALGIVVFSIFFIMFTAWYKFYISKVIESV